jgi:uncharacterized membrane protein
MSSNRLEAFSDGVIAIIITIMVLELKVPRGEDFAALAPMLPVLLSYVLSFIYVGIYWNNHHHMLHLCSAVSGAILWANLHLLFWLSLYPFTTSWMDSHFRTTPAVVYGVNLLGAAIAYTILQRLLLSHPDTGSQLREALGADYKGKLSPILYVAGIGLCFVEPWLGLIPFALVAAIWLVPDRRVERYLSEQHAPSSVG